MIRTVQAAAQGSIGWTPWPVPQLVRSGSSTSSSERGRGDADELCLLQEAGFETVNAFATRPNRWSMLAAHCVEAVVALDELARWREDGWDQTDRGLLN